MSEMFFGFGHGYGGTQLLARILDESKGVDCKHERRCPESKEAMFDHYKKVYHNDEDPCVFVKQEREALIKRVLGTGQIFGEINGILGFFVEGLYKLYPDAKFIYMFRDPRTQVLSGYNTGVFSPELFPQWPDPWWWPSPKPGSEWAAKWAQLDKLEKNAWFWMDFNNFVMGLLEKVPAKQIFWFKFEDMIAGRRFPELYKFLGISPVSPEILKTVLSVKHGKTAMRAIPPIRKWGDIPKAKQEKVLSIIKNTMEKLKYEV